MFTVRSAVYVLPEAAPAVQLGAPMGGNEERPQNDQSTGVAQNLMPVVLVVEAWTGMVAGQPLTKVGGGERTTVGAPGHFGAGVVALMVRVRQELRPPVSTTQACALYERSWARTFEAAWNVD